MTSTGLEHLRYRRLRAPREDRGVLIEPPASAVADLVAANTQQSEQACYDLQGRCLEAVGRLAREELLAGARRWTSSYRDVDAGPADPSRPIFLAGHQPELFHPGVWFKNFALSRFAEQHEAVAVNLIVDTDIFKRNSVLVPSGSIEDPHLASVPLDRAAAVIPFEEQRVQDREFFAGFGRRVTAHLDSFLADPLIREYWPLAVERIEETGNIGAALAQSRHALEGRWGLNTLEIPESWVCESESFRWLVAHILAQLPRFHAAYNSVVADYRRMHHIRSRSRPVPDLAAEGDWFEAPLWMWSVDAPRRRHLFARQRGRELEISDRRGRQFRLAISPDASAERAVEQIQSLRQRGVKIRSRALLTTLWARLALGELFLHGIGGAKYDQVTDALIARFFGLEPPRYMVVTSTLRLPVDYPRVSDEDIRAVDRRLRELQWHPEDHFDADGALSATAPAIAELIAAKRRWIQTTPDQENYRQRFLELRRINAQLGAFLAPERERLQQERGRLAAAARAARILSSREFAFCLFPQAPLREMLFSLLP